mgnify:CR=1 FL=1
MADKEVHDIILDKLKILEGKIDGIHTPGSCYAIKEVQKQINRWAGGLTVFMILLGLFIAFKG